MAIKASKSGQYIILVVLNNLPSCLALEGANAEAVCEVISKFQLEMEHIFESCEPIWSKIDIADARIIMPAEQSSIKRTSRIVQQLEHLHKKTSRWLIDEGFSEFKLSVGMETGHIILSGQMALGSPIVTAYVLADYGLSRSSVVASENIVSKFQSIFNISLNLIEIEVKGLLEKIKKVAVLPISEFN